MIFRRRPRRVVTWDNLADRNVAAILTGHAIVAESAALDLERAGIDASNLRDVAKSYRSAAARLTPTDWSES